LVSTSGQHQWSAPAYAKRLRNRESTLMNANGLVDRHRCQTGCDSMERRGGESLLAFMSVDQRFVFCSESLGAENRLGRTIPPAPSNWDGWLDALRPKATGSNAVGKRHDQTRITGQRPPRPALYQLSLFRVPGTGMSDSKISSSSRISRQRRRGCRSLGGNRWSGRRRRFGRRSRRRRGSGRRG